MIFTVSLTQNKDFLRLYKQGRFVNSTECVVYFLRITSYNVCYTKLLRI